MQITPTGNRNGLRNTDPGIPGVLSDIGVLTIVLIALALRLFNLGEAPLWLDETDSAMWIRMQGTEMLESFYSGDFDPNQLPLYFLVLKLWSSILGGSPWVIRLLSVVLSCATIYFTALTAATLAGRQAARWAAVFAAFSPYLLHHAQEARMYPLLGFLAAASILCLARYLKGDITRLGIGFFLINLAALVTHYYSVFYIAGEILALLLLRPRPLGSWMWASVASGAAALGLVLIGLLLTPRSTGAIYELGLFAIPGFGWALLSGYTFLPAAEQLHAAGARAALPYLPIAILAIAPLALVLVNGLRTMAPRARILMLTTLGTVVAGPLVTYAVFPNISLNPRYFMAGMSGFLVLLGAGAASNFGPRRLTGLAATLLLVIMVAGAIRHLYEPGHGRADTHVTGVWLDANVDRDQEILVTSIEMEKLAHFHWPHRSIRLYPDKHTVVSVKNAESIAMATPIADAGPTYYIFGRAWESDPDGLLPGMIRRYHDECEGMSTRGVRVYCFSNE